LRVLILTGKFGMGHVAAAEAVADQLRAYCGAQTEVVDLLESIHPKIYKGIYHGYNAMVNKIPRIYNSMICLDTQLSRLSLREKPANAQVVGSLVRRYRPDVIVSTWLFGSKYIEAYRKRSGDRIPFVTCITDIMAFDEWLSDETDAYIVGSEETKASLAARGVDPAIVHVGGVPVRRAFGRCCRPAGGDAREVLIMGGGLGFIPDADRILETLAAMPRVHATLITGWNQKLYSALKGKYANIDVLGYTDDVPRYMEAADVIVTKSGGATTFECIQAELPMFIVGPYFEQEKANAAYIEEKSLGRVVWGRRPDCGDALAAFLADADGRGRIKENMRALKENMRGGQIGGIIDSLLSQRNSEEIRLEG